MIVIKIEGREISNIISLVAKSCFHSGLYVQSFRLGNVGYVKIDKNPFVSRQEEPSDYLILADKPEALQDAIKHAKEKSVIIMNAKEKPKLAAAKKRKLRIYVIDATDIALNVLRKPEPDAVLLGSLVKVCDKITSKSARSVLGENKDLHIAMEEGHRNVK